MIGSVLATVLVIVASIGIYFYLQQNKKPETWVWVGEGEDPFKR